MIERRPFGAQALHYNAARDIPATVPLPATPVSTPFAYAEADRCVLCGLCLPHCPTYRLTQDENESPRGRISLMRALANGQLVATDTLRAHLSRCLGCRNCERACPSGVRYGLILETGRPPEVVTRHPYRARLRMLLEVVARPGWPNRLGFLLRLYQKGGLQWLSRKAGLLRRLQLEQADQLLPPISKPVRWQPLYQAQGTPRGRVALFLGCIARVLDAETLSASIRLLTRFGYDVLIPDSQGCCSALHREAGDRSTAARLQARNRKAFAEPKLDAIITIASGCGAALIDGQLSAPIRDIHDFLAGQSVPAEIAFAPLTQHVAVHDPCSLRNVFGSEAAVYRLLERIPGLRVTSLPQNSICCGGAGGYVLREPEFADRLRAPKIGFIKELHPDVIVSANIGCVLHLAAGLRKQGVSTPVVHPVVLLERQLQQAQPEWAQLPADGKFR